MRTERCASNTSSTLILISEILRKYHTALFLALLVIAFLAIGYHDILPLGPQSIHNWRQTDCLSLTQSYYNLNLPFLEPRLHHVYGNEGKTVGEFPILYYITAQLYHVFGEKEMILRLLHLICFASGLVFLHKLIYRLTENSSFSLLTPLLLLGSTILTYYANNFLPDAAAAGLSLVSLYYFHRYHETKHFSSLIVAIAWITLAGLIKITALIPLAALVLVYLLQKRESHQRWRTNELLAFIIPVLINLIWVLHANGYKQNNENFYLLMNIKPIWTQSWDGIYKVGQRLLNANWGWRHDFLPWFLWYPALAGILVTLYQSRKNLVARFIAFYLLISLVYMALMFPKFYHHDYYLIPLIIPVMLALIFALHLLYKLLPRINPVMTVILILWVAISLYSTQAWLHYRYRMGNPWEDYKGLRDNSPVQPDERVISMSDITYCGSLYIMNRYGWTNLNIQADDPLHSYIIDPNRHELNTPEYISQQIEQRMVKGAKYLIFLRTDTLVRFVPKEYRSAISYQDENVIIYSLK